MATVFAAMLKPQVSEHSLTEYDIGYFMRVFNYFSLFILLAYTARPRGPCRDKVSSLSACPDQSLQVPSLGWRGRNMKLNTHIQLESRLRECGSLYPLRHTSSLRRAQLRIGPILLWLCGVIKINVYSTHNRFFKIVLCVLMDADTELLTSSSIYK